MKKLIISCLLLSLSGLAWPENSILPLLTNLPYEIQVGTTPNKKIEVKGVCVNKIKLSNNNLLSGNKFRCEKYDMAGRFEVYSSAGEVVNKVVFDNHMDHSLPKQWREAGLTLGVIGKIRGTGYDEFRQMIQGAEHLSVRSEGKNDIVLSFEIGKQFYVASFWKNDSDTKPDKGPDTYHWRKGLFRVEVTENY